DGVMGFGREVSARHAHESAAFVGDEGHPVVSTRAALRGGLPVAVGPRLAVRERRGKGQRRVRERAQPNVLQRPPFVGSYPAYVHLGECQAASTAWPSWVASPSTPAASPLAQAVR